MIGLEYQPAFTRLLKVACGDPDWVAPAKRKMGAIKPKNRDFSQYYAESEVIATELDWNPSAVQTLCKWDYLRKWKTPWLIAICRRNFLHLSQFVRDMIIRFNNDMWKRRHRIRVDRQVSHLPPDLRPIQMIPHEPPPVQWLDKQDRHLWTLARVGEEFLQKKRQKGAQLQGVWIVVGLTIVRQSAHQGRRLRCSALLEQKWRR